MWKMDPSFRWDDALDVHLRNIFKLIYYSFSLDIKKS